MHLNSIFDTDCYRSYPKIWNILRLWNTSWFMQQQKILTYFYACHRKRVDLKIESTHKRDMTLDRSAECHVSRKNKQIMKTLSLLETRYTAYLQSASTSALDTRSLLCMCSITSISLGMRDLYCTCAKCWLLTWSLLLPIFLRHDFKEVNRYYKNLFNHFVLFLHF